MYFVKILLIYHMLFEKQGGSFRLSKCSKTDIHTQVNTAD